VPTLENMKLLFWCFFIASLSLNPAQLMLKEYIKDKQNLFEKQKKLFMRKSMLERHAELNFKQNDKPVSLLTERLKHKNRGRLSRMAAMLRKKQRPHDRFMNHRKEHS
jgi:hypothetical protein